jgi:hypothetical protein
MSDQVGLRELERRWRHIFATLHAGGEVSPGMRLRTEGMMEMLVLLGLSSSQELQLAMAACYGEEFGTSLEQAWGLQWRELFPFPQIPGFGQRAPVYPSTHDEA